MGSSARSRSRSCCRGTVGSSARSRSRSCCRGTVGSSARSRSPRHAKARRRPDDRRRSCFEQQTRRAESGCDSDADAVVLPRKNVRRLIQVLHALLVKISELEIVNSKGSANVQASM